MHQLAILFSVVEYVVPASLLKKNFHSIILMMTMTVIMTIPMERDSAPTGTEPFEVLVALFFILLALLRLCRMLCSPRVVIMHLVSCNESNVVFFAR